MFVQEPSRRLLDKVFCAESCDVVQAHAADFTCVVSTGFLIFRQLRHRFGCVGQLEEHSKQTGPQLQLLSVIRYRS